MLINLLHIFSRRISYLKYIKLLIVKKLNLLAINLITINICYINFQIKFLCPLFMITASVVISSN